MLPIQKKSGVRTFWTSKQIKSSDNFLLKCPMYSHLGNIILINISGQQNSDHLLIGSSNISDNENCNTFVTIQDFIIKSKRFA